MLWEGAIAWLQQNTTDAQCVLQTFNAALELAHFLGKETCISQDRPGFIVNRILMPMINEAFYTFMEVGDLFTASLSNKLFQGLDIMHCAP